MSATKPEIKTAVRFPGDIHQRLSDLADLTKVSQNTIVVDAVDAICRMAESEDNWIVPEIVMQARAVIDCRKLPFRAAPPQPSASDTLRAAEEPPGAVRKSKT